MVGIDGPLFYVPFPLLGSNCVPLLILLTPILCWCFVKHHAMQVYGGELFVYVVPCLTEVQMESCLRNKLRFFSLPPSPILPDEKRNTSLNYGFYHVSEGGNTELLLQNCFTLHIGW